MFVFLYKWIQQPQTFIDLESQVVLDADYPYSANTIARLYE